MASLRKRGRIWYYRFSDADGVKRERRGCSDRRATEEMARAAESEAAMCRAGLVDPKEAGYRRHAARPLAEHVREWGEHLASKGNTGAYARKSSTRAARVLALARVDRIGDMQPSRIQSAAAELRVRGLSLETCNHHLRAIKGFSRWLWRDGRAREDALAHLALFNPKTDRRHDRGALSAAEFDALIRATRVAPPFRGLSGEDRVMLYLVAAYTGLRAKELDSLTTASFDLDSPRPTVRVRASCTKNGDEANLPLRADLAALLRRYLSGRAPDAPAWPRSSWPSRAADMLKGDLGRAGVDYVDGDGHYRDFHSLRHRFGTELATANVPPKVAQALMRHSTISLTLDRYSHVGLHDTAGALDKLPALPDPAHTRSTEAMRATGTDPKPINIPLAHHLPTGGDGAGRDLAGPGETSMPEPLRSPGRNPLEIAGFDGHGRDVAASGAIDARPAETPGRGMWIPSSDPPNPNEFPELRTMPVR
jgi:integrase